MRKKISLAFRDIFEYLLRFLRHFLYPALPETVSLAIAPLNIKRLNINQILLAALETSGRKEKVNGWAKGGISRADPFLFLNVFSRISADE